MFKKISFFFLFVGLTFFVQTVFAGKMELTTYYPAPYGEYKDLEASGKLKIPVKTVGTDTSRVRAGEIWFETT